jgi:hypothetical protein
VHGAICFGVRSLVFTTNDDATFVQWEDATLVGEFFRLLRAGFYFSDLIANTELKVGNRLVIGIGHAQIIQMLQRLL